MPDAVPAPKTNPPGLVQALRGLTDGVTGLVRHHLELARLELQTDAKEIGKDVAVIAIAGILALVGYLFLNVAAILFSVWFGGVVAAACVALALALIHLGGGGLALYALSTKFYERHYGGYLQRELERSSNWAQQLPTPTATKDEETP